MHSGRRPRLAGSLATLVAATVAFAQGNTIEGVIRDSVTQQPIEGVHVSLRNAYQVATKTDPHGRFRLDAPSPGRHALNVKRSGYVDSQYGETFSAGPGDEAKIALVPTAAIKGILTGEDDRPIPGAMVYAGSFSAETGDQGHFLIDQLRPESYSLRFVIPSPVIRDHLRVDRETGDRFGYAQTFVDPSAVVLGAGVVVEGHRVRLRRQLLMEFSGLVVDEVTRAPLAGGQVELNLDQGNLYADDSLKRQAARQGRFHFDLVPPGLHTLLVYRDNAPGSLPFAARVDVGRKGRVDHRISLPAFVSVTAKLTFAREKPPGLTARLTLGNAGHSQQAELNSEGVATFAAVPPRDGYRLSANWSYVSSDTPTFPTGPPSGEDLRQQREQLRQRVRQMMAQGPPRWHVKRLSIGGRELRAHDTFAIAGPTEFEVLVSDATGHVVFDVTDSDGRPVPDAFVLLRSDWVQFHPAHQRLPLAEGDYQAMAFPSGTPREHALRAECGERKPLAVRDKADHRIALRVCR